MTVVFLFLFFCTNSKLFGLLTRLLCNNFRTVWDQIGVHPTNKLKQTWHLFGSFIVAFVWRDVSSTYSVLLSCKELIETRLIQQTISDFFQMLTVTSEGYRLLRIRDFDRNLDRTAIITTTISLGNDRAKDEARVGCNVIMREFGT